MDKRSIDDAACDSTKRLEEQVDEKKLRDALERFRKIYGMGAADGLTGVTRKGVGRHSK